MFDGFISRCTILALWIIFKLRAKSIIRVNFCINFSSLSSEVKRNHDMKIAEVQKLELKSDYPPLKEISAGLDELKGRLLIDTINWKGYDYKPDVAFSIAYRI